ncbi:AdoMet_MTases domain containing protein [Burkholderiaceae bacterium]
MNMQNPLSDIVSSQYQKWMYPEPIIDLELWIKNNWQWFDPSHAHGMFWPDRHKKADLDILIAGCGTNQAAIFAFNNPEAKVVAIDVSQPSLNHHQFLKDKYGMKNLELHLLPIEQAPELSGEFDLIVSTGVLHHLNDPQKGIDALAQCLRREGVMALMLYAKYGRIGVEMLQSVARDLGLEQNEQSLKIVREMLSALSPNHPIKSYLDIAPDLGFDAGLVDTFLHGRDRSYSIQDCFSLVEAAGLVFQDLFLKSPYYPPAQSDNAFLHSVAALNEHQQWSVMERINTNNACHFFTACRQERPKESYHINFDAQTVDHCIPELRYRCTFNNDTLNRYNWSTTLSPLECLLLQQVDGRNSIVDIISHVSNVGNLAHEDPLVLASFAKAFFKRLWQLDFLSMHFSSDID